MTEHIQLLREAEKMGLRQLNLIRAAMARHPEEKIEMIPTAYGNLRNSFTTFHGRLCFWYHIQGSGSSRFITEPKQ